MLHLA